jgi:copper chaperone NosL
VKLSIASIVLIAAIAAAALLSGCSGAPNDGPPKVRYGQDECVLCGMILTDQRHVAALRVTQDGEQRDLLFDDIGDMLEYERDNAPLDVRRRFVHDFETRRWIDAAEAAFLRSEKIHTPMGSGIVAFAEESRGLARATQEGAKLVRFAALNAEPVVAGGPCCEKEGTEQQPSSPAVAAAAAAEPMKR